MAKDRGIETYMCLGGPVAPDICIIIKFIQA